MTDLRPARRRHLTATPLVALPVGSCAVIYGTVFFDGRPSALVSVVAGMTWFVTWFLLRRLVQEAADLPDDRLDEREIAVRDRSFLEAYRLLGAALAGSLALAVVDDAVGDVVVSWNGAWAALLLLSAVLPSAVLAHRQRA